MSKESENNGYGLLLKNRKIKIQNSFIEILGFIVVDNERHCFMTSNDGINSKTIL